MHSKQKVEEGEGKEEEEQGQKRNINKKKQQSKKEKKKKTRRTIKGKRKRVQAKEQQMKLWFYECLNDKLLMTVPRINTKVKDKVAVNCSFIILHKRSLTNFV